MNPLRRHINIDSTYWKYNAFAVAITNMICRQCLGKLYIKYTINIAVSLFHWSKNDK